ETTAPRTRETAGEITSATPARVPRWGPGSLATCRRTPAGLLISAGLRRSWRFRSDFPTDARDPPLAIVRLRSSFRPYPCGRSDSVELGHRRSEKSARRG